MRFPYVSLNWLIVPAIGLFTGCACRSPICAVQVEPAPPLPVAQRAARISPGLQGREIQAMLLQVREERGAIFVRNGLDYGGEQAAEFLLRKWEHKGASVNSTEAFIQQVASRSDSSGEVYQVVLPSGVTLPLADWLRGGRGHAMAK